jgi:tetratricopeptide (TPR) repeat protein
MQQLYGNFFAIQGKYNEAIEKYENALKYKKMPLITGFQIRKNLSQCYFQTSDYKNTIRVLEDYKVIAEKRYQLFPPLNSIMLGISYYQEGELLPAYENISFANENSTKYKEDWLGYEFGVAIELEKFQEAKDVAQLLVFINPDKKEYWKQLSGLYYTLESDDESLAGFELAFERNTLTKEKEYVDLSKYYLYKSLPQKAVKVLNSGLNTGIVPRSKENYDLLADSYFLLKDRTQGINFLIKSLEIDSDPETAFKIGRFAFEEEDWSLAYKYLLKAKSLDYKKSPGRLDLLMGICKYETNNFELAKQLFNNALEFEGTKTSAEGWLAYIKELQAS